MKDRFLFHTALYDLDAFRRQVAINSRLDPLGIDATDMETILVDDRPLLEWGNRWVAFSLFAENSEW